MKVRGVSFWLFSRLISSLVSRKRGRGGEKEIGGLRNATSPLGLRARFAKFTLTSTALPGLTWSKIISNTISF